MKELSPIDIKCKKLNVRNLYLEGRVFHVSPRLHWIMGGFPSDTFSNFCGLHYNNRFKPYATSKMEPFLTKKKSNGWKLLLAAVT